jgi:hypothetical protein
MVRAIKPHPLKHRLKSLGISQWTAAAFLKISQAYLSQFLLGYKEFPKKKESELRRLLDGLEQQMPREAT